MALGSGAASGGCPSPVLVLGLLDGAAPLPRRRALLQCKPRFIHLKRQYFLSSKINPVDSLSLHLKIHFTASSKKKEKRRKKKYGPCASLSSRSPRLLPTRCRSTPPRWGCSARSPRLLSCTEKTRSAEADEWSCVQ